VSSLAGSRVGSGHELAISRSCHNEMWATSPCHVTKLKTGSRGILCKNQSKFWRQSEKLGPSSVPGMIAVLADGPGEYHTQAALVLSPNGIEVSRGGDGPDSDWVLAFALSDGFRLRRVSQTAPSRRQQLRLGG
jgi:hypothetical protein